MKFNPLLVIKLLLAFFICIGLGLTVFMVIQNVKIIGAYVVSGLFILVPGRLFYGFTFGFSVSEKTARKQAATQDTVTFDNTGISFKKPLFDITEFMDWKTIETVLYTNYQSDDHAEFIFYLTQPVVQTVAENPGMLNRIFKPKSGNKTEVTIADDCKNFHQIPEMLEKYLVHINQIDWTEDANRGTLLSSTTQIHGNGVRIEEHWKPKENYEREKVVYDRFHRTFQETKQGRNT